ncbi:long-chain fatty acid transport protein 4 [Elysia marginata]|uniref:Very long-chain fatty acid transport protein n=1 Tax=Elysia marginata TaxID=1093978 RepID=A0AAV4HXY2_9GAST|nr:long-chain fatty acid transport protein 4 [Elysia marginata]
MSIWTALAALFAIYLVTGGWKFMKVVIITLPRDLQGLKILLTIMWRVRRNITQSRTVTRIFAETVQKYPNKAMILYKDEMWTFTQAYQYSNRVANFLHEEGFRKGDVVAIFTENCPEYVPLWLGMSKIGVVAALINFNLKDMPLIHCIQASRAKALIFASNLSDALKTVRPQLPSHTVYYCLDQAGSSDCPAVNLAQRITQYPDYEPPALDGKCSDPLFYVYTSGTTGLPKAAVISNIRYCYMAYGVELFFGLRPQDVNYISLPLYHTAGGILGTGQAVLRGSTIALRNKFSASQFWTDSVKYNATCAQYIGEICRYLLAQPPRPEEQQHLVRVMFGNGIKPQIWPQFQQRFGVKLIGEFYGATEGNCNIVNFENKVGAVGFTTRIAPFLYPITLVKVDPSTNNIVRDSSGVCVLAKPGEPGELVGKIVKGNPVREFDGYLDSKASSKKIITDVFRKGDQAFSTGDILVMDDYGYMYFRDRTGDTFRWRGENVSTNEVEAVISNAIGLNDAVVYGVEVPGNEGKAGMAAIVDEKGEVDVNKLGASLARSLPPYARPLFVRFIPVADTTGTFKLSKTKLRDEGFDVQHVRDPMFFLNPKTKLYEPLTDTVFRDIQAMSIRL